ncbi:MAG: MarR family multiple antibiotic resistance transcriptional regulator [Flavobacteriales bacterium]|jgi:MarR family multiple antibiotic resistance transcriptional regulator
MSNNTIQDDLFRLVHTVKTVMLQRVKQTSHEIAPMHLRALKVTSVIENCTSQDIATMLVRDKAQIARLLNDLIQQNLLKKTPNPKDKRSQFIELTDQGQIALNTLTVVETDVFDRMLLGLSEQEQQTFNELTRRMYNNLRD